MRTVSQRPRRSLVGDPADRGAVLIWVAVAMVALLGAAAIVVDAGAVYVERRELQNGADAGALGVAADCALGDCADEWATAGSLVTANSKHANAATTEVCGSGPGLTSCSGPPSLPDGASGWVRVRSEGDVEFRLAPILPGVGSSDTVHADAVAAWGPPRQAIVTPLIFSECEFELAGGAINPAVLPSQVVTVMLHDPDSEAVCGARPSGADVPGGFGWLDQTGRCTTDVTVGDWVSVYTGNDVGKCKYDLRDDKWKNNTIAIALYDDLQGQGTKASYRVAGIVGLDVIGYRLPGNSWTGNGACNPAPPPAPDPEPAEDKDKKDKKGKSEFWICGTFEYVTLDSGDIGGPDFGARTIVMVG